MIVRVGVVPHPPILVPEVAAGGAAEITPLRDACLVVARALAQHCARWVAVAAIDPLAVTGAVSSFAGYGADVEVVLDPAAAGTGRVELPLPLLVAAWLRGQVGGAKLAVEVSAVAPGSSLAQCRRIGSELAQRLRGEGAPVGLLVLGDGAAAHTRLAPEYLDCRAQCLDAALARALVAADPGAVLSLDLPVAGELLVTGQEAWRVGAAAAQSLAREYRGQLLYSAAPYGVAYHVALWEAV